MKKRSLIFTFLLLSLYPLLNAQEIRLKKSISSIEGTEEIILTLDTRGWYSLQAESSTGAALEIIDRMAGRLKKAGQTGEMDGRIDMLLEAGEYKIILYPDLKAKGKAELRVFPYKEVNPGKTLDQLPFIRDGEFIKSTLKDMETRSYWVYFDKKELLRLEILGRNITDCQVWKEGRWIETISPARSTYAPVKDEPMTYFEFYHSFSPGYYLIRCIGGPPQVWTNQKPDTPLYIRRGLPQLGDSVYENLEISPFGRDVYLISGSASFFELSREEKKAAKIGVGSYYSSKSRFQYSQTAQISEKSDYPRCALKYRTGSGDQLLVIQAEPEAKLKLLFFPERSRLSFSQDQLRKNYIIAGLTDSSGFDALDISGLITNNNFSSRQPLYYKQHFPIELDRGAPLVRKTNLFGSSNLLIKVGRRGTYRITETEEGASAKYKFSFLGGEESSQYGDNEEDVVLSEGYYLLTISPIKQGILHFILYNKGDQWNQKKWLETKLEKSNNSFILDSYYAGTTKDTIFLYNRYDVNTGLIYRPLPMDLSLPFPFILNPGQKISFPMYTSEEARLNVTGKNYTLLVDGKNAPSGSIKPGEHNIELINKGNEPGYFSLKALPLLIKAAPVPPVILNPEEQYTVLTKDHPIFQNYDREEKKQFLLKVEIPALYRLETTGRLNMGLRVRTPLTPSLFSASNNSVGRNAVIQSYLKPGIYLVEVYTRGKSQGRAGLHLQPVPLSDGGRLFPGMISRQEVDKDEILRFSLTGQPDLSIKSYGLNRTFYYRLEDSDGWPVVLHSQGEFLGNLGDKAYFYYSLPENLKTKRLIIMEENTPRITPPGVLELNFRKEGLWTEKEGRPADPYTINIPAPLDVQTSISQGMVGTLYNSKGVLLGELTGTKTFHMDKGLYTIQVRSKEENDKFPYSLYFSTTTLAPGLNRLATSLPTTMQISIDKTQSVNIWSLGNQDIKAELYDNHHLLVDRQDDREHDWNFLISRILDPGIYNLKLEANGRYQGGTTIFVDKVVEKALNQGNLGFTYKGEIGNFILKIDFTTSDTPPLAFFKSIDAGDIEIALYKGSRFLGSGLKELYIPLEKKTTYTLHIKQRGYRDRPLTLETGILSPMTLVPQKGLHSLAQANLITNKERISFRFSGDTSALFYSPAREVPCQPCESLILGTREEEGWLINKNPKSSLHMDIITLIPGRGELFYLEQNDQSFTINNKEDNILIISVLSPGNKIGLMVETAKNSKVDDYNWNSMTRVKEETLGGIPGAGEYRCKIWTLDTQGTKTPASVNVEKYKLADDLVLPYNSRLTSRIQPGEGVLIKTESLDQRASFLLAAGLTAFSWHTGKPVDILSAGESNLIGTMDLPGGIIAVVNRGKQSALFRIDSQPLSREGKIEVTSKAGFEALLTEGESLKIKITPGENSTQLLAAGENFDALLRGDDGRLYQGVTEKLLFPCLSFPAREGVLEIKSPPGFIKVWLSEGDPLEKAVSRTPGIKEKEIAPSLLLGEGEEHWRLSIEKPLYVQLTSSASGILALYEGKTLTGLRISGKEQSLIRYLEAGEYTVVTRPFEGHSGRGTLQCTLLEPVHLGENQGPGYFISTGENQIFTFDVSAEGTVGIGIKAEKDALEGKLYDKDFKLLKEGPLIFETLVPGTYYYLVSCPGEAVQYDVLVEGEEGSITGIPQDVIESYKN